MQRANELTVDPEKHGALGGGGGDLSGGGGLFLNGGDSQRSDFGLVGGVLGHLCAGDIYLLKGPARAEDQCEGEK